MSKGVYDHSSLQAYKNCPESYRLKYVEHLKKRVEAEEEHDKNFGRAIHAALELLYKSNKAGKPLSRADYHAAFEKEYPVCLDVTDLAKTPESGLLLLDKYAEHYGKEDSEMEILAVEVTDTFPIGKTNDGETVEFTVKIDLIVKKQGCVYFMDHKTTGRSFSWDYWAQFDPNAQITAYAAYCMYKYGECSGGIINALRFGHRQRAYKGEPAGYYQEFQRNIINRNPAQIAAWKGDTINWIQSVRADKVFVPAKESWGKNEGACRYCSYKEVCLSVNDEQVIEQLYEKTDSMSYLKPSGELDA